MKAIVLSDDDLKYLEKRFGPEVRHMGTWNSDGVFSYESVPVVAVQKAVESLDDPALARALSWLTEATETTKPFIELIQSFGSPLIDRIVAAYRECCAELIVGARLLSKPPQPETRESLAATAVA